MVKRSGPQDAGERGPVIEDAGLVGDNIDHKVDRIGSDEEPASKRKKVVSESESSSNDTVSLCTGFCVLSGQELKRDRGWESMVALCFSLPDCVTASQSPGGA